MSAIAEIRLKNEAELVQAAREGSVEAFGEIVRRHHRDVRGFLARYLFDQSVVDDLAQEVFLSATTGIGAINNDSAKPWLLSIAKHKAIDYLRSKARTKIRFENDIEAIVAQAQLTRLIDSNSTDSETTDMLTALRICIKQLNANSQKLVNSFYYERQTAESIASRLDRSAGTIRMALLRVRKALAKCIRVRVSEINDGSVDNNRELKS